MQVFALVSDLFFQSRIEATARALAVQVRFFRRPTDFQAAIVADVPPPLCLIDANVDPSACLDLIRAIRTAFPAARIVAFLSHVQLDLARQCEHAGATDVWPRSRFAEQLPTLLSEPTNSAPRHQSR